MKLSKKSLWLYLYQFNRGNLKEKASNVCSLFWNALFGALFLVTSPLYSLTNFIWPNWAWEGELTGNSIRGFASFLFEKLFISVWLFLSMILGNGMILGLHDNVNWTLQWWMLFTPLIIVVGMFTVLWLIYKGDELRMNNTRHKNPKPGVVSTWWKGFKERHCALIEWKD